jgi:hypothetical protein
MLRRFEGMCLQRDGTGTQGCQDQFLFRNVGWILHDLHSIFVWSHLYRFDESAHRDAKLYDGFGFLDCGSNIIKETGVGSLWPGFIPIWEQFVPTATIQLLIIEVLYGVLA